MKLPSQKSKGFTLIEVLIAVAVLGIALFAVIRATQQTARSTSYLQSKITADLVANDVMARARSGEMSLPISGGQKSGNSQMLAQSWQYYITLKSTSDPKIQQLTVTVKQDDKSLASLNAYVPVDIQGVVIL